MDAAIRYAPKLPGIGEPPTNSEMAKPTVRGIRLTVGAAQARKAPATAMVTTVRADRERASRSRPAPARLRCRVPPLGTRRARCVRHRLDEGAAAARTFSERLAPVPKYFVGTKPQRKPTFLIENQIIEFVQAAACSGRHVAFV